MPLTFTQEDCLVIFMNRDLIYLRQSTPPYIIIFSMINLQAWTIWYNQWLLKKQENHKEMQAKMIAQENMQLRCFKAWKLYVQERRRKTKLKGLRYFTNISLPFHVFVFCLF